MILLMDSERTLKASKYASFSFRGAFSLYVDSEGIRLTYRLEHFPTVEYTGSRSRWPPSKNMRRHGCSRAKRSRGAAERGNAQGGKRRGKAFFHMLIHQAGCAHEYLWSKHAFLSFPSFPLSLFTAIFPCSLALVVYTLSQNFRAFSQPQMIGGKLGGMVVVSVETSIAREHKL